MKFCKPHNRNYPETAEVCPECETRVVREASRLPYRVTHPQEHDRCREPEGCGNLLPVCRCDMRGSISMPELPGLLAPSGGPRAAQ